MSDLTKDVRRILEDQSAIHGSFLPLPDGVESRTRTTIALDPEPEIAQPQEILPAEAVATDWSRLSSLIPTDSPLHGFDSLDQVAEFVAGTKLIPIDEQRLNPVPGVGNPNADLMVVGEAPGAEEDKKGEPFVGRAGQLLDKILAAVDFARSEVFIANILKSRPPRNRDPEPAEIAAHLPILLRQITLVQPRVILCVGRVAGNVLLEESSTLKALRQRNFHDFHGVPMMVTYHPAALLRSAQYKRPTWEDVQRLRALYDELTTTNG